MPLDAAERRRRALSGLGASPAPDGAHCVHPFLRPKAVPRTNGQRIEKWVRNGYCNLRAGWLLDGDAYCSHHIYYHLAGANAQRGHRDRI